MERIAGLVDKKRTEGSKKGAATTRVTGTSVGGSKADQSAKLTALEGIITLLGN